MRGAMSFNRELLDQIPHDLQAEQALIGSVLLDPAQLDAVVPTVSSGDFHNRRCGLIFGHCVAMRNGGGGAVDETLLVDRLKQAGDLDAVGGLPYLAEVAKAVPVASHAEQYAGIVRQKADYRSLIRQAEEVLRDAHGEQKTPEQLAGQLVGAAGRVAATTEPPVSLREMIDQNPKLRPPVIEGLLRQGETMNLVASPKAGKSWLASGLALSVADGRYWLDTFPCAKSRVLVIDAELHPETISHRLPMVGAALEMPDDYAERIDVWALRGKGDNLFTLGDRLQQIEPGQYGLIIADAWYRFLPPGISENDNASVMALYNAVDAYASRLKAAWVNVHHTSKGDQSSKGTTDVGSGAGSQSRAADTHLVIRPHETDGVAVMEAVVRSWPAPEPLAIRWHFPVWTLDAEADPTRLLRPAKRGQQESREADQRELVRVSMELGAATKTHLRSMLGWGGDRFNRAFVPLETDGTLQSEEGRGKQGQKRELWSVCDDSEF